MYMCVVCKYDHSFKYKIDLFIEKYNKHGLNTCIMHGVGVYDGVWWCVVCGVHGVMCW